MSKTLAPRLTMFAVAAVVGLAGCASETSAPTSLRAPSSGLLALGPTNATPVLGQVKVCKSAGSNASGIFAVSLANVGGAGTFSATATIAPGTCRVVAEDLTTTAPGNGSNVTVDETSAGFVDGSVLFVNEGGVTGPTALTDNSTYFVNAFHGYVLTYNNTVVEHPPEACDFITFGRLVTYTADGTKVVISGNAGGNAPGGGFLGHINIQVGDNKYNVKPITGYGPIAAGALSTLTNSRFASGVATNGATIEVRLYDGGEPGKGTDIVALKINGINILAAAGQTIDQGNMQYHSNCRGPSDVED
ncbi:MAG: hypothetical protein ABIP93_01435 [Gemmatimonadaceae bacterium]